MRTLVIAILCYLCTSGFAQQMNLYQRAEAFGKQVVAAISTGKAEALRNVLLTDGEVLILERDRINDGGQEVKDKILSSLKVKRNRVLEDFEQLFKGSGRSWRGLEYKAVRFNKYIEGKQTTADIEITAGVGDTLYTIRAADCVLFNVNWKAVDDLSFQPQGRYMPQETIKNEILSSINPGDRSCSVFVDKAKTQVADYFISKEPYTTPKKDHYFGCKIVFESDTSILFNTYPGSRKEKAIHSGNGIYLFTENAESDYATSRPFRYQHYSFEYKPFDETVTEIYVYESDTTVIQYERFEHPVLGGYLMNFKTLEKEGPVYSVDIVPVKRDEFQLQLQLDISRVYEELEDKVEDCEPSDSGKLIYINGKWYFSDQHEPRYVPVKLTREGFKFTIEENRFGFRYSMENDFKRIK